MQKRDKTLASVRVKATSVEMELEFNDPSWKQKFQEDWNDRMLSIITLVELLLAMKIVHLWICGMVTWTTMTAHLRK